MLESARFFIAAMAGCLLLSSLCRAGEPPQTAAVSERCAPLSPPEGAIVKVANVSQLLSAVSKASPGSTILLADGTYALDGAMLRFSVPGVTLRSASGNRDGVVLDGAYRSKELAQIVASNVTLADLTLKRALHHAIHVMSGSGEDTLNTRIYNVHVIDPGEQGIKINPAAPGHYTDGGEVACSTIELTDRGRGQVRNHCYTGGIDAHQSRGWVVRDNRIEGFWCAEGLSEHAIHFWRGSRDTVVLRNILKDNARGVGFGLERGGQGRRYDDAPCGAGAPADHYRGVISGNTVLSESASLFASRGGADCGICLWDACGARVQDNAVSSLAPSRTYSSIECRFPGADCLVTGNRVNVRMLERDGARMQCSGNLVK